MRKRSSRPIRSAAIDWETPRFKGNTFCFTGTVARRADAIPIIEAEGGKIVDSVTCSLNYLVVGAMRKGASDAERKARTLNQSGKATIELLDEAAFHALLMLDADTAVAILRSGRFGVDHWNRVAGGHWLPHTIPISRADFRNCDLSKANLVHVEFIDCDFRGAQLKQTRFQRVRKSKFDGARGSVSIGDARDCSFTKADLGNAYSSGMSIRVEDSNLDGASICRGSLNGLKNCSAKRADLSNANVRGLVGTNLTAAKLTKLNASHTDAADAVLDRADLTNAELRGTSFRGASFKKSNLSGANLEDCDLTGADLTGARLSNAVMSRCKLHNATLSNADLRKAVLCDADFTGATLDGANLAEANVAGANLTSAQIGKCKGLKDDSTRAGSAGPRMKELVQIAGQCKSLRIWLRVDLDSYRYVEFELRLKGRNIDTQEVLHERNCTSHSWLRARSLTQCMLQIANRWTQGTPRFEEVTVTASKSPMKAGPLRALAVAAWCEAFGRDVISEGVLDVQQKQARSSRASLRTSAVQELQQNFAGASNWNKLSDEERVSLGRLRKLDLSKLDLKRIDMRDCDLQNSNFSGATLLKADFARADLRNCNFDNALAADANFSNSKLTDSTLNRADLKKTRIRYSSLARASLADSDLTGADVTGTDLRGADLSSANLAGVTFGYCQFDEQTAFPPGFKLTDGFVWAGKGKDPRLIEKVAQLKAAGPVDFASFMQQLEKNFDQARLKKALAMLKAESFQLFGDVQSDSVTGVVKSQTDPDLVYSCRLDSAGGFACCTQNLNPCGGLRGALCKHLLVLIIGLTRGEQLDATSINAWVIASKLPTPQLDKELMSEALLKYKGAEAGEIDWRPTETVPEDFYAY